MKKKGRILVIDDNEAVLSTVRGTLQMAGYEVVATSQIVGTARHLNDCELVIIDYHMPGLDGGEVLSSLRAAATKASSRPLFYLYTSDLEIEKDPADLGFDGVFTKKGNREALLQNVDAAFRLIRLRALQQK